MPAGSLSGCHSVSRFRLLMLVASHYFLKRKSIMRNKQYLKLRFIQITIRDKGPLEKSKLLQE
jgi:hypothetical protein